MKEYLAVLKIVLKNNFRSGKNKYLYTGEAADKKQKAARIANTVGVTLGIAATYGILFVIIHVLAMLAAIEGLSVPFLSTLFTGVQLFIIFFGMTAVLSNTFFSRDNDFLASLPVKPTVVFAVKMTVIYINEFLVCTLFLVPMIAAFISGSVVGGATLPVHFYVMLPLVFLTVPVIPLMLVSILSFPMIKIIAYFKNRSAVTLVASILLFCALIALYMAFIPNMEKFFSFEGQSSLMTPQIRSLINGVGKSIFYNKALAAALLGEKFWINMLIFIATVAVSTGVTTGIASLLYRKAAGKSGEETRKKVNVEINSEGLTGRKKALFIREFRTLFRNQSFAFNSVMGSVMTPIIILIMNFTGMQTAFGSASHENPVMASFANTGFVLFYCLLLLCGTNYSATLAFSREGNTFYMLRYLPVDFKELVSAKVKLANVVSALGIVLTAIIVLAFLKLHFLNALPLILAVLLYSYAFNSLGIYRDLKRPNVNWINPYEVIKKNFYPAVIMFYAMGIGMLFMLASQLIAKYANALNIPLALAMFWLLVFAVGAAILVVVKVLMKKRGRGFFDRISFSD